MPTTHRWALTGMLFIGLICVAARRPGASVQVLLNDRPIMNGSVIESLSGAPDSESGLIFVLRNTGDHPLRLTGPLQIHGPGAARLICASPPEANGGSLAPGQSTAFRIELPMQRVDTPVDAEVTIALESAGTPAFAFRIRSASAPAAIGSPGRFARGQQHVGDAAGVAHPDFL